MVQSHFGHMETNSLKLLRELGIPYERHIETAVECLAYSFQFHQNQKHLKLTNDSHSSRNINAEKIIEKSQQENRNLLEPEALKLLENYGVSIPDFLVLKDPDDIKSLPPQWLAEKKAVKIISKDIIHKSDIGGVRLNVTNCESLNVALGDIEQAVLKNALGSDIHGFLVSPMAKHDVEVLIGVLKDQSYGNILVVGIGVIFVELIQDLSCRNIPISKADAQSMIFELNHKKLFEGFRNFEPVDIGALTELLVTVSKIAHAHPEIKEIDLNPVIAHPNGYTIVDARFILNPAH